MRTTLASMPLIRTSNNGTRSHDSHSIADRRSHPMKVLFVGDVVGKPGRQAVAALVPAIKREERIDLAIVNGENAAGGAGLTGEIAREIHDAGADVITNGNHVWDQRAFLKEIDALLAELGEGAPKIRILDWHAEATSEKLAMGWHLDGRFSAVLGSHTHVPTADARILPQGTALVADTGMVGPRDSVLGIEPAIIVARYLDHLPRRFEVATGVVQFNSVVVDVDDATGRARSIERLDREWAP